MYSKPDQQIPRTSRARPTSLQIQHSSGEWTPDLVVDDFSQTLRNGMISASDSVASSDDHADPLINKSPLKDTPTSIPARTLKQPLNSPCFIHSLLDKGASFQDWLYHTGSSGPIGVSRSLSGIMGDQIQPKSPPSLPMPQPASAHVSPPSSLDDQEDDSDIEGTGSLTRQLAETAVGVREMSKQLGASTMQHISCVCY